jgi:hypothetical protein
MSSIPTEATMKHLVQVQLTSQDSEGLSVRHGGPVAFVGRLVERFAPEAVYMSPARRACFLVCDLEPRDMAELMLAGSQFSGQVPDFIPVIAGSQFADIVATAHSGAKKLLAG